MDARKITKNILDEMIKRNLSPLQGACLGTASDIVYLITLVKKRLGNNATDEDIERLIIDNLEDLRVVGVDRAQGIVKDLMFKEQAIAAESIECNAHGHREENGDTQMNTKPPLPQAQGEQEEQQERQERNGSQDEPRQSSGETNEQEQEQVHEAEEEREHNMSDEEYEEAYYRGFSDGLDEAEAEHRSTGIPESTRNEIYEQGKKDGEAIGRSEGYKEGYLKGYDNAEKGVENQVCPSHVEANSEEFAQPVQTIADEDKPIHADYTPDPTEWNGFIKAIRWNMAHPGQQKNIMYVGDKGLGKTRMITEGSELLFGKLPYLVTCPQTEWKVTGGTNAMGDAVLSVFVQGFQNPGIILIDEIEKSDPTALVTINAALANHFLDVPGVGIVRQHPQCTIVATSNTSGRGASSRYNTANPIDESTRDRFIYRRMTWKTKIALSAAHGDKHLVRFIEGWNKICKSFGLDGDVASYRVIEDILADVEMGETLPNAIRSCLTRYGMDKNDVVAVMNKMNMSRNEYWRALKIMVDDVDESEKV